MNIFFAGGGKTAEYVAHRILRENHTLVIVDKNEQRTIDLADSLDATVLCGDVTCIEDLREAGLERADIFVACTASDETNMLACLIADDLAPDAVKAIVLSNKEHREWGRMLHNLNVRVDRIVHPETDIAARIMRVIRVPGVADIRDFCESQVKLFAVAVDESSRLNGMSSSQLAAESGLDMQACTVFRGSEALIPSQNVQFIPGDSLYIITSAPALPAALEYVGIRSRADITRVFIVGGNEIAFEVAQQMQEQKINVKLFDTDLAHCEILSQRLADALVLHADGTDQDTLIKEGIHNADVFIALTPYDSQNIVSALLARRFGVNKVIAMTNKISNQHLAFTLGINTTVSPRVKIADALLETIRGGGVLSVRTLGEEEAEAIEVVIDETLSCCGCAVHELALPKQSMLGAVVSATRATVIPSPDQKLCPGDRAVFFVNEKAIADFERNILGRSRRHR